MMPTPPNQTDGKIKILFLLPDLSGGGAERTLLNLLRHMNRDEFELCVGLWIRIGPLEPYIDADDFVPSLQTGDPLKRWVAHQGPAPNGRLSALAQRYIQRPLAWMMGTVRVSKIILETRPDLIVSFMPFVGVMTAFWLKVLGRQQTPWIARVGNNTTQEIAYRYPYRALQIPAHALYQRAYRHATKIIAISHGVADDLQQNFNISDERMEIIYNPVDSRAIREQSLAACGFEPGSFILAVGRLEHQKGFDLLIRAFSDMATTYDGQLIILGEGSQRTALVALIEQLGLDTRVHLPGFVDNPWRYMSKAKLFVLPSRWEGFAHVVVEAMLCGVPVVVTDCDFGPREIIRHGESGVVVPADQVTALRDAMWAVLSGALPLDRIVSQAVKRAQSFDQVLITQQYENVFKDVIAARHLSPNANSYPQVPQREGDNAELRPICVLGGHEPHYPRHLSLQQALQAEGRRTVICHSRSPFPQRHVDLMRLYLKNATTCRLVYITEGGHRFVPWVRVLSRWRHQRVLFDPFLSRFNTRVEDRKLFSKWSARGMLAYAQDWLACKASDYLIFDTHEHRDYFFATYHLDKPSAIIPIGVADPAYREVPDWPPKARGTPTLLFYGTYIPLQGIETIIRAIPMTRHTYHARIIGRGQTFDDVQTIAKELKIAGRVDFASPVSSETLPAELAAATIVLGIFGTTAKAARVVPNKVVQAAAAGRPIITRDSAAIRRYFTHESDIYLVPPGAPEALAHAIDTLNASPHLCERLGAGARRVFDANFSPPVIAAKFMQAIRDAEAQ